MEPESLSLPRRGLAALVAVVVVVAGVTVAVVASRGEDAGCGAATVLTPHSPLLDAAGMATQPDHRLETLSESISAMGPPFGTVRAGVGYDYDQWLHLYGVTGGVLAWTKNNAPVTFLDDGTLFPRWSLRPATQRTAWDASDQQFLLLALAADRPTQVGQFNLRTGEQDWCTELAARHHDGDPVATTFLEGGDVLAALPGKRGMLMTRLGGDDGRQIWRHSMTGVGRADFLAPLNADAVVAGGTEEFRLADPAAGSPAGPVITAFSAHDGRDVWTWGGGPGSVAHVVGVAGDQVLVVLRSADGLQLLGLDGATGSVLWKRELPAAAYSSTLRGDTVLVKSAAELVAFDAASGERRWSRKIPTDRTYFPYGFTLDQMPSLDDRHVLVPTTTGLLVLDLATGTDEEFALPVDGLSTTYWPYQLLVTAKLLGVVTNTGGILTDRVASR